MVVCDDDIVIAGIGGRFPNSSNLDEFKQNLLNNKDFVEEAFPTRKDGTYYSSRIKDKHVFDNLYFNTNAIMAEEMEVYARLVQEAAVEAIYDAGINPVEVRGTNLGVYMGVAVVESDGFKIMCLSKSYFGMTGFAKNMIANRLSYSLNCNGPSFTYYSSNNAGFVGLEIAVNAIKHEVCDAALVGTAQTNMYEQMFDMFSHQGLLSKKGVTKPFDDEADGYARGEGVVCFYVTRKSLARKSYASIVHVKSVFDSCNGLHISDINSQNYINFLKKFYEDCKVDPRTVEYLEAYGCGLKLIDQLEIDAAEEVMCKNRQGQLLVGSVKSNVGLAGSCSDFFGIVKALISLSECKIPATLHYSKPNKNIKSLLNGKIKVVDKNQDFKGKYVAINGFGIASEFGHMLLKSALDKTSIKKTIPFPFFVPLTSRTEDGLMNAIKHLKSKAPLEKGYVQLLHSVFSQHTPSNPNKACITFGHEIKEEISIGESKSRPVWFVYSGMGSQWVGMGAGLMQNPFLAKRIDELHNILVKKNVDLKKILTTDDPDIFENILHSFVGIAAIQIVLTDLLFIAGIKPDGIIGHSVGELGCAYADKCLTDEEMILSAYCRGKASLDATLIRGAMAAIGVGYSNLISMVPPSIEIACRNGPGSSTISGPVDDVHKFVNHLTEKKIFARMVNSSNIAYHSRYIQPAGPLLLKYEQEVIRQPKERSAKWVSSSIEESRWDTELAKTCSAEYLANNLLSSVLFEETSRKIPEDAICIEIAPHGLLQAILKRSLGSDVINIPLASRGDKDPLGYLANSFGKMFLSGMSLDSASLYCDNEFPVTSSLDSFTPLVSWNHENVWNAWDGMKQEVRYQTYELDKNSKEWNYLKHHTFRDNIVLSAADLLNMVINLVEQECEEPIGYIELGSIVFKNYVASSFIDKTELMFEVFLDGGIFHCSYKNQDFFSGKIKLSSESPSYTPKISGQPLITLTGDEIYEFFDAQEYHCTDTYRKLKSITFCESCVTAKASNVTNLREIINAMIQVEIFSSNHDKCDFNFPQYIRSIALQMNELKDLSSDIDIIFEKNTKTTSAHGITLQGAVYRKPKIFDETCVMRTLEFVPFKCDLKDLKTIVDAIFQILLTKPATKRLVVQQNIEHDKNRVLDICNNVKELFPPTSIKICETVTTTLSEENYLKICDQTYPVENFKTLRDKEYALYYVPNSASVKLPQNCVVVCEFSSPEVKVFLLKQKREDFKAAIVDCGLGPVSSTDLVERKLPWVNKLFDLQTQDKEKVFIVLRTIPTDGTTNFMKTLHEERSDANVILLLTRTQQQDINIDDIVKKNLDMAVYHADQWGTFCYKRTPMKPAQAVNKELSLRKLLGGNIHAVCLNDWYLDNIIPNDNTKYIDYAGVDEKGKRLMGVALMRYENSVFNVESKIEMSVPAKFSFEDAATVPHDYLLAYYYLVYRTPVQSGSRVLVNDISSSLAMAIINTALAMKCEVMVSVKAKKDIPAARQLLPGIKPEHILCHGETDFEYWLAMLTTKKRNNLVFNFADMHVLYQSMSTLVLSGNVYQVPLLDKDRDGTFTRFRTFLNYLSLHPINPNHIFDLTPLELQELKDRVLKDLDKELVKPLKRQVYPANQISDAIAVLEHGPVKTVVTEKAAKVTAGDSTVSFQCDSSKHFVVSGDNTYSCIKLTEWLISRGAKKILVHIENLKNASFIDHFARKMKDKQSIDIQCIKSRMDSYSSISNVLQEKNVAKNVDYFFKITSNAKRYDEAEKTLLALMKAQPSIKYVHICKRFPGCLSDNLSRDLIHLFLHDLILMANLDENLAFALTKKKNVAVDCLGDREDHGSLSMDDLLPFSLEEIIDIGECATDSVEFKMRLTQVREESKELRPLFVIPGLHGMHTDHIKTFCNRLEHQAYFLNVSKKEFTIESMAAEAIKKMKEIFPSNMYTVVGISFGGPIAIEMCQQLSKQGVTAEVILLDGVPKVIKSLVSAYESTATAQMSLLTKTIKTCNKKLLHESDWSKRLSSAVNSLGLDENKQKLLCLGLNELWHKISAMMAYKPSEYPIKGKLILIQSAGSCEEVTQLTEQAVTQVLANGTHSGLFSNAEAMEIVNVSPHIEPNFK